MVGRGHASTMAYLCHSLGRAANFNLECGGRTREAGVDAALVSAVPRRVIVSWGKPIQSGVAHCSIPSTTPCAGLPPHSKAAISKGGGRAPRAGLPHAHAGKIDGLEAEL